VIGRRSRILLRRRCHIWP